MSTTGQNFTDNLTEQHIPPNDRTTAPSQKKKIQTPYKPRLSTLIKRAMEDCVNDAVDTQRYMYQILAWLQHETDAYDALLVRMAAMPTPLDWRMAELMEEEKERRFRIAELQGIVAHMALSVTSLERRLRNSLDCARQGVEPAKRKRKDSEPEEERTASGERRQ